MIHLKRFLWLLAWAGWIWLGFGLWRELPREYGEPIAKLPYKDRGNVSFIGDGNRISMLKRSQDRSAVEVYDAEGGALIFASAEEKIGELNWYYPYSVRHPAFLVKDVPSVGLGYSIFDFTNGKWRHISKRNMRNSAVHSSQPWILLFDDNRGDGKTPQQVAVLDWETGKETVVCQIPPTHMIHGRMAFLENPDRVTFKIRDRIQFGSHGIREVWRLADPPVLEKRLTDVPIGTYPSNSNNGRLAFDLPVGSGAVEVYDLNEDKFIFANFPPDQRPTKPPPGRPVGKAKQIPEVDAPVVSPSGRAVFGGRPTTLWEVDSGKVLWQSEQSANAEELRSRYFVTEDWRPLLRKWLKSYAFNYETLAVRDLESGRLIVRMRTIPKARGTTFNSKATLAAGGDRQTAELSVYRIPQTPNWPLLALCQTILALPLVMLWAVLRWRRRRRRPAT
jgi:hypothetical protein